MKKRKKSGQLMSQPFVVIFSLIVIALIIIFGFRAISGLIKTGDLVATKKFEQDLRREVGDIYTQPSGSNVRSKIATPNGIKAICIADLTRSTDVTNIPHEDIRQIVDVLSDVRSTNNVFFSSTKSNVVIEPLDIPRLKPRTVVCDSTLDGTLDLILENRGNTVDAKSG